MSRIATRFHALRERGEKALIPFVVAGDPALDQLPAILETLAEAGADLIEVGIPFSDPIADGPTIQAASQRALDRGVQPPAVLDGIARWSESAGEDRPALVLMGYYNPILRWGLGAFAEAARAAGADGTIVSDLTPEESDDWIAASRASGLDTVFLAAPTSTDERLDIVCARATGFVYAISRTGVTGATAAVPEEVRGLVGRVHARTSVPVAVGFGIRTPEQVGMVCEAAEGAVVGSALVDLLAAEWQDGAGRNQVLEAVRRLKTATRLSR
ncbi:MAG TPA: tryptophan synthase subunit alpha [Fimbriimonadaceae bacterium]|nr:tryptophan synthase subunit alpha [Fimbriimonadaceae bacterium]